MIHIVFVLNLPNDIYIYHIIMGQLCESQIKIELNFIICLLVAEQKRHVTFQCEVRALCDFRQPPKTSQDKINLKSV